MEINLFGAVGDPWEEITASAVAAKLGDYNGGGLVVNINSPGGFADEGIAVYNLLKPHEPHVRILGLAASAASVIAMAGSTVEMLTGSRLMIHKAWSIAVGDDDDMLREATALKSYNRSIADVYSAKTGIERSDVLGMMAAETWLSADEAVEQGFADQLDSDAAAPAPPEASATLAAMRGLDNPRYRAAVKYKMQNLLTRHGLAR